MGLSPGQVTLDPSVQVPEELMVTPRPPPSAEAGIIAGGAISGVGSLISSGLNMFSAYQNRKWQERMANTAHQREVADLRAAGLNPILSATGGGGAPTPSAPPAQIQNPFEGVGSAVSSAAQSKFQEAAVRNANSATALQLGLGTLSMAESVKDIQLKQQEIDRGNLITSQLEKDLDLSQAQIDKIQAEKASAEQMKGVYETLGPWGTFILDRIFPRALDTGFGILGHSAKTPAVPKLVMPSGSKNHFVSPGAPKPTIGFKP